MKFGIRTPSFKRSLSAATKGAAKRALMREIIPYYGKRGMGWTNPRKAVYNRVYNMSTANLIDTLIGKSRARRKIYESISYPLSEPQKDTGFAKKELKVGQKVLLGIGIVVGCILVVFIIIKLIILVLPLLFGVLLFLSLLFKPIR